MWCCLLRLRPKEALERGKEQIVLHLVQKGRNKTFERQRSIIGGFGLVSACAVSSFAAFPFFSHCFSRRPFSSPLITTTASYSWQPHEFFTLCFREAVYHIVRRLNALFMERRIDLFLDGGWRGLALKSTHLLPCFSTNPFFSVPPCRNPLRRSVISHLTRTFHVSQRGQETKCNYLGPYIAVSLPTDH